MSASHNRNTGRAQCARTPDPCNKVPLQRIVFNSGRTTLLRMTDRQSSGSSPRLDHYSYFDRHGNLHTGTARSKRCREVFVVLNTIVVIMAALVGLCGGFLIGFIGYPIIGVIFSAFVMLISYIQFSTFNYERVYGVWRGACPYCGGPLNLSTQQKGGKAVSCPTCKERFEFKGRSFIPAPWYTP
jgi:hypothetical protein